MPQPGSTPTADHPASIPTRHQPLEESRVGDFGCWIDGELADLDYHETPALRTGAGLATSSIDSERYSPQRLL